MTTIDDKLKWRLVEEFSKSVYGKKKFFSSPYNIIDIVLHLVETPERYEIILLSKKDFIPEQNPIDTISLGKEAKNRLRRYVYKLNLSFYSVGDALTDTVQILSDLGVIVVDAHI
jgi:hypothetical protein